MSGWVAGAIAVAGIAGAVSSSNAANRASSGAQGAARDANSLQWNMFQQNRNDQSPWRTTGGAALGQLSGLMGLNSQATFNEKAYLTANPEANARMFNTGMSAYEDAMNQFGGAGSADLQPFFNQGQDFGSMGRAFSAADYQADPGYQFRLEQGAKALERAGAARGSQLSGAQIRGVTDYNSGMASQEYGNAYNRFMQNRTTRFGELSNLAGLGQSSVGQTGSLGQNAATNMGSNLTGAATVAGNAGLAAAGAWNNALNTGANTWQQYQQMNQVPGAFSITGIPGASTPNFGNNWGQPVPTVPVRPGG